MLASIGAAKIRCVGADDDGYPVMAGQTPKVCRFDQKGEEGLITCDLAKFSSLSESDQYVLIHHEFAGLAEIELPNGDESTYGISNQISGFLINVTLKKLAVRPIRSEQSLRDFDPLQKLEDGKRIYARSLEALAHNRTETEALASDIANAQAELESADLGGAAMKDVLQNCSDRLGADSAGTISDIRSRDSKNQQDLEKTFIAFKSNVENYVSAQNCSLCDAETRSQTMAKYQRRIEENLVELNYQKWNREPLLNFILSGVTGTYCNFDRFFEYNDSRSFNNLRHWAGSDYRALLSVRSVLSEEFKGTLEYLNQAGSIRVNRNASNFGKPFSQFKNGQIKIQMTYDWDPVTGYDNVEHPGATNPISIIHLSRK